jgi:hypothetical protein
VRAADWVEDDVHAVAREALNLFHTILMLVINWATPIPVTVATPEDERVP